MHYILKLITKKNFGNQKKLIVNYRLSHPSLIRDVNQGGRAHDKKAGQPMSLSFGVFVREDYSSYIFFKSSHPWVGAPERKIIALQLSGLIVQKMRFIF